jgi:hypothetical protein
LTTKAEDTAILAGHLPTLFYARSLIYAAVTARLKVGAATVANKIITIHELVNLRYKYRTISPPNFPKTAVFCYRTYFHLHTSHLNSPIGPMLLNVTLPSLHVFRVPLTKTVVPLTASFWKSPRRFPAPPSVLLFTA